MQSIKFQAIPQWAIPAKPDAGALFETFALLGIEGQWVRLSAADQRAIMGAVVFGKKEIKIEDGEIAILGPSIAFGQDRDVFLMSAASLRDKLKA